MDTRHKSRNYNLLVLCGLLCRLLENAPADGWVSRREVLPWLEDLVGKEGLEELERRIFDCSEEGFCIFDRERDGKYRLAFSRPPRLAPTGDEAGLLLWLLERGWGKLFLEPETQELLLGRLEAHRRGPPAGLLPHRLEGLLPAGRRHGGGGAGPALPPGGPGHGAGEGAPLPLPL